MDGWMDGWMDGYSDTSICKALMASKLAAIKLIGITSKFLQISYGKPLDHHSYIHIYHTLKRSWPSHFAQDGKEKTQAKKKDPIRHLAEQNACMSKLCLQTVCSIYDCFLLLRIQMIIYFKHSAGNRYKKNHSSNIAKHA